jgi:hypothetical protein
LALRSEEFNNAYWTKADTTASGNVGLAPDGTTTADLLTPNSTGTDRRIEREFSATLVSGTVYTQSFFVKTSGFQWVVVDGIDGNPGAWFDLINGIIGTVAAGNTAEIRSFGNGWYRCSVTRTASSTTGYVVVRLADANNSSTATASGSNGLLLWGAQLEAGPFPTTYTPTVTATVTRPTDQVSYANFPQPAEIAARGGITVYWAGVDLGTRDVAGAHLFRIGEGVEDSAIRGVSLFPSGSPAQYLGILRDGVSLNSLNLVPLPAFGQSAEIILRIEHRVESGVNQFRISMVSRYGSTTTTPTPGSWISAEPLIANGWSGSATLHIGARDGGNNPGFQLNQSFKARFGIHDIASMRTLV